MAKIKFTAGRVDEFQCEPGKSRAFLWDNVTPGLGLRATASGAKVYIFQGKLKREVIRITIGDPDTWSLDAPTDGKGKPTGKGARQEARRLRTLLDEGEDPRQVKADALLAAQEKRDAKDAAQAAQAQKEAIEQTKRELIARVAWDAYLVHPRPATGRKAWGAQHRADHIIAANQGGDICKIGDKKSKPAPLASLLSMPIHAITADVVQKWLARECTTRATFAHNSFRKFRTFIKWCAKQPAFMHAVHADCCTDDDVKNIIPTNKTKDGDCLQREQLADWFDAVRKISSPVISAYLQALLITGARRGELELLKWTDVEFNPKWSSMTIRDKVEGLRTIPLTPYLSHLLAALPRRSDWVFSSPTAASGHITEPRIAHTKALQIAGLPHVSLHGMRRSFGTLSEWVEVPVGIVAQIQGHSASALAEKHYRRRPLDLLRMWHVKIEAWMLEQAGIEFVPAPAGLRLASTA